MKCPSCNKFATYDTSAEPEVDLEVDAQPSEDETGKAAQTVGASVTGTCRIVLTSECCGDELKEATFDISEEFELERSEGCECDLSEVTAEDSEVELTDRRNTEKVTIAKRGPNKGQEVRNPIPSRYQTQFYGASMTITVSCACGKTSESTGWSDFIQASSMDEMA